MYKSCLSRFKDSLAKIVFWICAESKHGIDHNGSGAVY